MDSVKKEKEYECFQRVIQCGKLKRGETKRIIMHLNGEDVYRKINESPDIVKYCKPKTKGQRGTIIGIEHFQVDHLSLKKQDGKVASTGVVYEKNMREVFNKWHSTVATGDMVPDEAISDIAGLVAKRYENIKKTSYNIFIDAFKYSLDKHLQNVELYRRNLSRFSSDNNVELAFLIEIHTEFLDLYLNDEKGTHKQKNGHMPMFGDVVRLLENIERGQVNYIVLCIGATVYNKDVEVFAFRARNIRKQLERYGISVYEYVGEDCLLTDFQTMYNNMKLKTDYTVKENKVDLLFQCEGNGLAMERKIGYIFYAFKEGYYLRKSRSCFATTLMVQYMLDVYGDYVTGWISCGVNKWNIKPVLGLLNLQDIQKKEKEFEQKWILPLQTKRQEEETENLI